MSELGRHVLAIILQLLLVLSIPAVFAGGWRVMTRVSGEMETFQQVYLMILTAIVMAVAAITAGMLILYMPVWLW